MEQREEREEDFCRIFREMETGDKEKVALTAKKLLIAQETIRDGKNMGMECEEVPV